jgi:hypothetical protein
VRGSAAVSVKAPVRGSAAVSATGFAYESAVEPANEFSGGFCGKVCGGVVSPEVFFTCGVDLKDMVILLENLYL